MSVPSHQSPEYSEDNAINPQSALDRLLEQNQQLLKEKKELENTLESIVQSKSWRLTGALRNAAKKVRMFFPLICFRKQKLRLQAGRNVVKKENSFDVIGPSPTIFVESSSGNIPRHWVKLSADFESERNPLFFLLYFGKNGQFNPQNRVWITLNAADGDRQVFYIPEWADSLRLDPFDSNFEFTVNELEIRELGKLQVVAGVLGKHLAPSVRNPGLFIKKFLKLIALFKEGGLSAVRARLFADDFTSNYQEWVRKYDSLTDYDRALITEHISKLNYQPLVSIVMPVHNVPEKWLRAAIDSVRKQLYSNWELCIADDASSDPLIKTILQEYQAKDARIKVTYRETNGHISAATNSALALAGGEFVALLDNDDELTEHALYMVVEKLNSHHQAGLLYSDEDKITSYGMRFNPYFKSDYNPALLLQQNFICHLGVYRTSVLKELGGFRAGLEGAQDWDMALRVIEKIGADKVVHIPHVLYHWRVIEGSTAQATSHKPYVMQAQARAVKEHLERSEVEDAEVLIRDDISQLRVIFPVPRERPKVSLIIPTHDQVSYLRNCVSSILEKTDYDNFEMLIVNNNSKEPKTFEYLASLKDNKKIRVIEDSRPFNFSQINNSAAGQAEGEVLGFLNNDLSIISKNWLSEMLSQLFLPQVGAVGAKLFYPNDLLQHAGIVLGIGGVAGHSHKGRPAHDVGYFNRCILNQNVSGVTAACMLVKRAVFEEVGGFDQDGLAIAFNDVDLCLKIRKAGYWITYCAYAELYHYESISRGFENTPQKFMRFEREIELMKKRWGNSLLEDPFYNPNLTILTEDYSFAFPPRTQKPWRS